jgi:hypothetical protein
MSTECETLINMITSSDEENFNLAKCLINELIRLNKKDILKCLKIFFDTGIYSHDPFYLHADCDYFKFKLELYFRNS